MRHISTTTTLPYEAKRQYLLTLQVSRYCLLALQGRTDENQESLSNIIIEKLLFMVVLMCDIKQHCSAKTKGSICLLVK